ncbi:hypothetical protein TrRE_jg10519 [Triparma retinervis]|uniref:Serine-threonine kinase receptor-associated protein n=1 Tax=Triparma retinervis TaxID=2557542 RepID=A0A9W7A1P1_9STRA|nr:hypothetical protein TrRE_jg10519 [Triparma retinervis]
MSAPRQIPIVCPGHTRPLAELQFCKHATDGSFLMSACHDKTPMIRRGDTGDWIGSFVGHKGAVWSAKLDRQCNLAASASGDFSARLWDGITGACLTTWTHKHIVKAVEFSPESTDLATGGHEGVLRIFDLNRYKEDKARSQVQVGAPSGKANITKLAWGQTPALSNLVIASDSLGKVTAYDVRTMKPARTVGVQGGVMDMELNEGLGRLTVSAGKKVTVFEAGDFGKLKEFDMPISFAEEGGCSMDPQGGKFVAGGSDLWVRVFDYGTGECLETNKGHHGPVRCVRFNPDGGQYATGSEDGTIRIWRS